MFDWYVSHSSKRHTFWPWDFFTTHAFTKLLHMCRLVLFLVQLKVTNEDTWGLLSLSCQGCLLALRHCCQHVIHKNASESPSLLSSHVFSMWLGSSEVAGAIVDNIHFYASQGLTEIQDYSSAKHFSDLSSIIYCKTVQVVFLENVCQGHCVCVFVPKCDCCSLIYCIHRHSVNINTGSNLVELYFYSRFQKNNHVLTGDKLKEKKTTWWRHADVFMQRWGVTEWFHLCSCKTLCSNFVLVFPLRCRDPYMSPERKQLLWRSTCAA